jgi:hypothetical protein
MAGTISFALSTTLILAIFCLYTVLVCSPLLQVSAGTFNQHWIACTASGVGADELGNVMDANLQTIVRSQEQHSAELMFMSFANGVAMAVIAHGLALMAFFGTSIQEIASNNFGEGKDSVKSIATMATWFITGAAYMAIVLFVASYPRLSGEGDGEWTKDPDFGLTNANCYGENPWFNDFEEQIQSGAGFIIVTLNLVNLVLVCIQAFVNGRSASKAEP